MAKTADQIKKELREFTDILKKKYNLYALVLFGSYADGTASEYSDIDIAVFSDDFGEDVLADMKQLFKLRRKVATDIEPLPFRKKDFYEHDKSDFIHDIVSKGKLIFKEGKFFI
jgi:predicted nucleotidyltransferase